MERALVDVVNKVGVDINRAVNDPYYASLLPYVAGLGPRKAEAMVKKISQLVIRRQLMKVTFPDKQYRVETWLIASSSSSRAS